MYSDPTQFTPLYLDYHNTMAALTATGQAITKQASFLSLTHGFWRVDRRLTALLLDLDFYASTNKLPEPDLVAKLREVYGKLNQVLDLSSERGLTNRTLIALSIDSLKHKNEALCEILENFELAIDASVSQAVKDAIDEFDRGETISLTAL